MGNVSEVVQAVFELIFSEIEAVFVCISRWNERISSCFCITSGGRVVVKEGVVMEVPLTKKIHLRRS